MIFYDTFGKSVACGFTTREGGVSPFPENAMNMSFKREPDAENVRENYRRAAALLGVPFEKMTGVKQVHGRAVLRVTAELAGSGIRYPSESENGFDAMITDVPDVTLCTVHADCTPVLLYDPVHRAAGAVHSGWRGTVQRVSAAAVEAMQAAYGTDPAQLQVLIGPSISRDCFETDEDVYTAFHEAFGLLTGDAELCRIPAPGEKPKWHLSVAGFVRRTLLECGVPDDRIFWDRSCTFTDSARFFSHRRDRGTTGAMAAMIAIRGAFAKEN